MIGIEVTMSMICRFDLQGSEKKSELCGKRCLLHRERQQLQHRLAGLRKITLGLIRTPPKPSRFLTHPFVSHTYQKSFCDFFIIPTFHLSPYTQILIGNYNSLYWPSSKSYLFFPVQLSLFGLSWGRRQQALPKRWYLYTKPYVVYTRIIESQLNTSVKQIGNCIISLPIFVLTDTL